MPDRMPDLDPLLEDFLDDADWRPNTIAAARSKLRLWEAHCATTGVELTAAGHRELTRYLRARRDQGTGAATRHKDWQVVRALYRWLATPTRHGGAGALDEDPMTAVKAPHVTQQPATRAAKRDEVDAMIRHLEARARLVRGRGDGAHANAEHARARRNVAMVLLMFTAGLRSGELPHIDLADLGTRPNGRKVIALRADHTKTDEPRLVPITDETERALKRYLRARGDHPGPLFEARWGRRLTARAVQDVVERAADAVGVPVTAHQLRRGFTAEYLRAGGDVLSLEVIGGWSDHRMPRRYLADEERLAALDRFDQVTRPGVTRGLRAVN